jgi:hypothetical protein
MSEKAQTLDEKFIVRLFRMAMKEGDPSSPLPIQAIAKSVGCKEVALKNVIKHLAQANLIRKLSNDSICLTPRGCDLALELSEELE